MKNQIHPKLLIAAFVACVPLMATAADSDGDGLTMMWKPTPESMSRRPIPAPIRTTRTATATGRGTGMKSPPSTRIRTTRHRTPRTTRAIKPNIPYPLPAPDASTGATNKPVKVYILSGQSNMEGMALIELARSALPGTLDDHHPDRTQVSQPAQRRGARCRRILRPQRREVSRRDLVDRK